MEVALVAVIVIVLLGLVWYRRRRHALAFFKRIGIPGPEPHFLTGNLDEILTKGFGPSNLRWMEKYGDIVGYFLGAKPLVQVTDPELMKVIQVQEYSVFNNRESMAKNSTLPHNSFTDLFTQKEDYRWKTYRSTLTPAISASKMKLIMKVWNMSFEKFFPKLKEEIQKQNSGGLINISDYLRLLTIENFFKSSLSADHRTSMDTKDIEFRSMVRMTEGKFYEPLVRLQFYFPEIRAVFDWIRNGIEYLRSLAPRVPSFYRIAERYRRMVLYRQKHPELFRVHDLFQAILDIRYNFQNPNVYKDKSAFPAQDKDLKETTVDEIQSDAMFLTMAGFETTSLILGYILHLLAHHPEVQERLRQEIDSALGARPMQYDDLPQLPYLEQVINEALRLYPSTITFTTRVNNRDFTFKNFVFPRGTGFVIPVWALHRSPDLWDEPLKFDPDRFSPERRGDIDLQVYQPFGRGQRICYGERYALNQVRSVTCQFLQKFRLEPSPNRPEKLPEVEDTLLFIKAKNGIEVKLVPLESVICLE